MKTNYTHNNYSLADIERYLRGKMTPEEMHAIEKAALQDPFLADAIDGFDIADTQLSQKHLNEVTALISGKKEEHKVIVMTTTAKKWRSVAAAILVLIGIGTITVYLFNNSQQNKALSTTETVKPLQVDNLTESKAIIDSTTEKKLGNKKEQSPTLITKEKITEKTTVNDIRAEEIKQAPPINSEQNIKQVEVAQSASATSTVKDKKEIAVTATTYPKSNPPVAAESVSRDRSSNNNYTPFNNSRNAAPAELRGRVLNNNGEPLSYASVEYNTMNNSRAATITDANGNFELRSYDTTLKVDVATVGYERQRANISANRSNIIVLNEEPASLSEIVISGMNSKKQHAIVTDSVQKEDVYPKGGWVSFEQYAQRKLGKVQVKDSLAENEINEDFVEVEFVIDNKGKPENIALLHSSGLPEKDKEIIRMIKEGPKWVNKNKKAAKRKVVIKL